MKRLTVALIGAVAAVLWSAKKAGDTADAVTGAIEGGQSEDGTMLGATIDVRLTGYWPFVAGLNAAERLMEGGSKDRRGARLHTLEEHQADPVSHPYVAVSGDDAVWPYGQRIEIANWPGLVFRVVDTGGHFRGAGKVYRVAGYEPLDICVESSDTVIDPRLSTATVVRGDNFAGGRDIVAAGLQGQEVSV